MSDLDHRIPGWLDGVLAGLEQAGSVGESTLRENGRRCAETVGLAEQARRIREENPDAAPEVLVSALASDSPEGTELTADTGGWRLVFKSCTCPLVSETGASHPFLCRCTVGFTEHVFSTLFGRDVEVKLQQSILMGDSFCEQRITLPEDRQLGLF